MGLSQSCLGAPRTEDFKAPSKAGAQRLGHNVDKTPAVVPVLVKEDANACISGACEKAEGDKKLDVVDALDLNRDAVPNAVLETAQLSGAFAATATTGSLQSTFMSSEGYPHSGWDLGPPSTDDEQSRVQALRALDILDCVSQGRQSKMDEEADMVLGALMEMFNAMTAMLVLFDDTRLIIRNSKGVMKPGEFPHRWSFCAYTLTKHRPQTLVVPDATKDCRFCDNPFVRNEPHVRFYCGAPLVSASGHILGTLCFADNKPRPGFDVSQCYLMNNLAEIMVRHLERYRAHAGPAGPIDAETTALARVARTIECYEAVTGLVDISLAEGWMLMYVNEAWEAVCSPWTRKMLMGRPLQQLLVLEEEEADQEREKQHGPEGTAEPPLGVQGNPPSGRLRRGENLPTADEGGSACVAGDRSCSSTSASGGAIASGGSFPPTSRPSATRSYAGTSGDTGPGIVMDGSGCAADRGADARLVAMPGQERRQWRRQQERRPAASAAVWQRHAAALRSGEEVELGRARLLMADGQPSTTVVRVTARSANCHVLDAAVRMPVGVPHQLGLPPSILAAGAAGGGDLKAPLPAAAGPAACQTDGSQPSAGEAAVAAQPAIAAEGSSRPDPHYCIVTLMRMDDIGDDPDNAEEGVPAGDSPAAVAGNRSGADCYVASAAVADRPSRLSGRPPCEKVMSNNTGRPSLDSTLMRTGGGASVSAAVRDLGSPMTRSRQSCGNSSRAQGGVSQYGGRPSLDTTGPYGSAGGGCSRGLATVGESAGAGRGSSMRSNASLSVGSWTYGMMPFPGLKLWHLLGKGGYGRVFAASYKGEKVAAKVVSNAMLKSAACVNGVTLEALLTQEIEHPYIVRTYKCVVRSYCLADFPSAAYGASARNSAHLGTGGGLAAPYRSFAPLPPATPSVRSTVPAGPSDCLDVPRAGSRLACTSEVLPSSVAVTVEAPAAAVDAKAGVSALSARDFPRAVAAAGIAAPETQTAVVPATIATLSEAATVSSTAVPATAPSATMAAAATSAQAAATAPVHPAAQCQDFDSFDVGGEEAGGGGMIDQLTSAGPPVYVPQSAAASHAGAPSAVSHLPHHAPPPMPMHVITNAPEQQSVAVAGGDVARSGVTTSAAVTQGSVLSTTNASVEHVIAALAAPAPAPPRVPPGVAAPADSVSAAAASGVFTAAAAAAAAAAAGAEAASSRAANEPLPDGETWILQEFCGGGTLQDAVDSGRLRTEPSRLRGQPHMPHILLTAQEVASAMCCVHSRGYMHGDLSAVNVLLVDAPADKEQGSSGRGWVAKVSDFGLAKHLPDPTQPCVSSAYGVITHCAPEVLKYHTQTQKADVYSFGVLLWQMYTGSRPWANMNRFQIFGAVTSGTSMGLRFLPTQQPPPRYRDLALRCMSFDPTCRPTFAEVCEELRLMTYEAAAAGELR